MNTPTIYFLADIIATISEEICFCYLFREKGKKVKPVWKELLLFVVHFILVEILTYFNSDITLKFFLSAAFLIFFGGFVYNSPRPILAIKSILVLLTMVFAELTVFILWSAGGRSPLVIIEGVELPALPIYFYGKSAMIILVIIAKKLLSSFDKRSLSWKNAAPFLIMEVAVALLLSELVWVSAGRQGGYTTLGFIVGIVMFVFSFGYYIVLNAKNIKLAAREELERQKLEELEKRYTYYDEKLKDEERVRSIYHDMKNHLLLLETKSGSDREAKKMIETLQKQVAEYENYYHTGNTFLDVIIRDKARKAQTYNIDFSAMLHFEEGNFIEPLDISTIFGNALDNAIEASLKLPQEQRLVTVKTNRVRDMLSIVIENNFQADSESIGKSSKEEDFLHGFGIKNIKKSVEKYGGQCVINADKELFSLKIIIPIP